MDLFGMDVFNKKKRLHATPEEEEGFILSETSPFIMREAYTTLRTNILFSLPQQGCKVIAVTSSEQSEGKTTNCLNTAISFGMLGMRVLIIDCDLRRPRVSKLVGQKDDKGLSHALVGLATTHEILRKTAHQNLDAICAGEIPPNPTELLGSERMAALIAGLRDSYDYIFLDTPPVCVVPDALILAKHIDGMVLVARSGSSDKRGVAEAVRRLEFGGVKLLGYCLAGIELKEKKYGYKKYGYSKYGYNYKSYGYGSDQGR